jgi:UDP-N-acetylmuramyl pentapeptide phosphotransferase/UDP-N-acetylglucosamine-1-phosphate transferase
VHATDVSRLGGVAVWGAVAAVVALAGAFGVLDGADFARVRVMWVPLALGAALLAVVGVVDDVRGSARGRSSPRSSWRRRSS